MDISSEYKMIMNSIIGAGVLYLKDNTSIETLVVEISGKVDGAVVAAIARKICDVMNKDGRKITLSGYNIKISNDKNHSIEKASVVGRTYCDSFTEVNLSIAFIDLLREIDYSLSDKYLLYSDTLTYDEKSLINDIKSRMSMVFLNSKVQFTKGIVLSTNNLTEYYLGLHTLHGNTGDLGLINNLWKTEVLGIADLIGQPVLRCAYIELLEVDAYKIVDEILISHISKRGEYDINHPIIKKYEATKFKRVHPININRDILLWRHMSAF